MAIEVNCCLEDEARELLAVLTLRVRVLSFLQVARTWPKAVPGLKRLERHGLVFSFTAVAHPELPLVEPVIRWNIGTELPNFGSASYRLRSRWNRPGVPTKCIIASQAAGRMFGGHGGRYPRECEETHDIHLAAVYLRFRSVSPGIAASWVHEEEIKRERRQRKGKLPDALVGKSRVVEFGGAYKKEKLISFHKFFEAKGFDYEVW
jgi:hypothetical protein